MERFTPILKEVAVSGLLAVLTVRHRRNNLGGMGLSLIAGSLFVIAAVFLAIAGFYFLQTFYSAPVAFALMGLLLIVAGAFMLFMGRRAAIRREMLIAAQSQAEVARLVDLVADDLGHELADNIADPVRENPKSAMAAAIIAGFLTGGRVH